MCFGNGQMLKVTKIGRVVVNFDVYGKLSTLTVNNVYFVKNMRKSFCTISKSKNIVTSNNMRKVYCNIKVGPRVHEFTVSF